MTAARIVARLVDPLLVRLAEASSPKSRRERGHSASMIHTRPVPGKFGRPRRAMVSCSVDSNAHNTIQCTLIRIAGTDVTRAK